MDFKMTKEDLFDIIGCNNARKVRSVLCVYVGQDFMNANPGKLQFLSYISKGNLGYGHDLIFSNL